LKFKSYPEVETRTKGNRGTTGVYGITGNKYLPKSRCLKEGYRNSAIFWS
jgi:hypothetical protein